MANFKFHVVTVVGIFVALALGIVIGTSLSDNIIIESQMSTIELMQNKINTLEEEKAALIVEVGDLKGNIKDLKESEEKLFSLLLKDYEDIDNVTLITFSKDNPISELPIIKRGKISFQNIILIDEERLESEDLQTFLGITQNINKVFSEKMANFLHNGDDLSIKYLEEIDLVTFYGDYDFTNQQYIFYFTGDGEDELLKIMAERLYGLNNKVVAITSLDSKSFLKLNKNIVQISKVFRLDAQIDLINNLIEDAIKVSGN
ncbi:copper transporter [Anaerobranca gottschalkii]|uniref:Copper transport outer membrane protein, MctB n=1 Tax=Anaerobranca gottschalkii DSM 13577 TaxID=1120990 RepID=A0A1H9Y2Z8_9FIRM|nr:copper transporter [Anaerobranca gottschalkii]SES62687.1 Copper transport outer membrane protein, MctB [Anaerobranca gottschalkii DSM 13577]